MKSLWRNWHLAWYLAGCSEVVYSPSQFVMLKIFQFVWLVSCRCLALETEETKHAVRALWLCGWFTIIWMGTKRKISFYYQLIYFLFKRVFMTPNIWVKNTKASESPLQKLSLNPRNYSIKIVGCFVIFTIPLFRKFIHVNQNYHGG